MAVHMLRFVSTLASQEYLLQRENICCFSQSSGKIKFQFTLKKFLVKSSRDNLTINIIFWTFQLCDIFVCTFDLLLFFVFLVCTTYFPFLRSEPANILFTIYVLNFNVILLLFWSRLLFIWQNVIEIKSLCWSFQSYLNRNCIWGIFWQGLFVRPPEICPKIWNAS